jgi:hypothetical protein
MDRGRIRDPGLALSRNSGGSRAANADGAPCKHAAFHSSRPPDRKALSRAVTANAGGPYSEAFRFGSGVGHFSGHGCGAGTTWKDHMTAHSRGAMRPGFAPGSAPGNLRAQGRPGAHCTRGLVRKIVQRTAHEHTGSAETLRPSLRSGSTAYAALSPATNSSCHRHRRINGFAEPGRVRKTSADLTPATGARTTRFCRTLQHRSSACC